MVRLSLGSAKRPKLAASAPPAAPSSEYQEPPAPQQRQQAFDFSLLDKSKSRAAFRASFHEAHQLLVCPQSAGRRNVIFLPSTEFQTKNSCKKVPSQTTTALELRQCMECFAQSKLSNTLTVEDRIRAYQRVYSASPNSLEYKLWRLMDALYGNTWRRAGPKLSGYSARILKRQKEEVDCARVEGLDVWLRSQVKPSALPKRKRPTLQDLRRATVQSQAHSRVEEEENGPWLVKFANAYWQANLLPLKRCLPAGAEDDDAVFSLLLFAAQPSKANLERFLSAVSSRSSSSACWHFAQVLFELLPLEERAQIRLTLELAGQLERALELDWAVFLLEHYVQDEGVKEKLVLDLVQRNLPRVMGMHSLSPEYKHWAHACHQRAAYPHPQSMQDHLQVVILCADQDFFCTTFGAGLGPKLVLDARFAELAKFERYLVTSQVKPWERQSLAWACLLVRFAKLQLASSNARRGGGKGADSFQSELERFCAEVSLVAPAAIHALRRMADFVAVTQQQNARLLQSALQGLPLSIDLKKKLLAQQAL